MQTKKLIWLGLVIAGVMLLAGCQQDTAKTEQQTPPNPAAAEQAGKAAEGQTAPNAEVSKTMPLVTYAADKEGLHLVPEKHVVPFNDQPARTALHLLAAGTKNTALVSLMPTGAEVLGIEVKDHIAYVNFNDKLQNVRGSTTEFLLVGAIVNTLTEFPEIHKVQIMVSGKKIATLSGHLDISEPLERMEEIIKK